MAVTKKVVKKAAKPVAKKKTSAMQARLDAMQDNYEASKDLGFGEFPDGEGIFQCQGVEVGESKNSGRLQLHIEHHCLRGEAPGETKHEYMGLESDVGLAFVRRWIEAMGAECPEHLRDLEEVGADIAERAPVYLATIETNKRGFQSVRVGEMLAAKGEDYDLESDEHLLEAAGESEQQEEEEEEVVEETQEGEEEQQEEEEESDTISADDCLKMPAKELLALAKVHKVKVQVADKTSLTKKERFAIITGLDDAGAFEAEEEQQEEEEEEHLTEEQVLALDFEDLTALCEKQGVKVKLSQPITRKMRMAVLTALDDAGYFGEESSDESQEEQQTEEEPQDKPVKKSKGKGKEPVKDRQPTLEELVALAQVLDVEIDDDDDAKAIVTKVKKYRYPKSQLEDAEYQLLKIIGAAINEDK